MTDDKKREKNFDAVQWMRHLREKLSQATEGMSYQEEKEYIRKRVQLKGNHSQDTPAENAAP